MFKFIKKYAETIDGIELYPIVSLLIFFVFFFLVIWKVNKMSNSDTQEMKKLPLE